MSKWKNLPHDTLITGLVLHIPKKYMLDQSIPKSKMVVYSGWHKGLWLKTDMKSGRIYPLTLKGGSFNELDEWTVEQKKYVSTMHWISCSEFTCGVEVDDSDKEIIVNAAPILNKFMGQPFQNLTRWMKKNCTSIQIKSIK